MPRLLAVALLALGVFSAPLYAQSGVGHPPPIEDPTPAPYTTDLPFTIVVEHNQAYGPDLAQALDVYRPVGVSNAPVIFMVHGGGWREGDKAYANVVQNKVAHWVPKGYVFVSINYRLVPAATPLQQASDVARALAYAQAAAASWGASPTRFILMGHSAGAHLVSLVNANPAIASQAGALPWMGTVALDSAAYNVVSIMRGPHPSLYDDAFGADPAVWRASSPTLVLATPTKPMTLVCSTRRADSCSQAAAFAYKDTNLNAYAEVAPFDLSHGDINDLLGLPNDLTIEVDAFLQGLGLP